MCETYDIYESLVRDVEEKRKRIIATDLKGKHTLQKSEREKTELQVTKKTIEVANNDTGRQDEVENVFRMRG